ncbi:unnamed protein product [Mytilus edulis]|uniref:Myb/SANT-like DNA-binding domain-containing protein n=1 Tax=Mytilus edulis TaxID=6550 RepID=A0A8S3RMF1_MYTED|nr:unnamed protein product [Mytilus edulis]
MYACCISVNTACSIINFGPEYHIDEDTSLGKIIITERLNLPGRHYDSSWRVNKVNSSFVDVYFLNSTQQNRHSLIVNVTGSTDLDMIGDCSGLRNASFVLTCGNNTSLKTGVWKTIACQINALGLHCRTGKEVKTKWQNLQSKAKTQYAEKNKYSKQTGGGPAPKPMSNETEKIVEMMKDCSSFVGLNGCESSVILVTSEDTSDSIFSPDISPVESFSACEVEVQPESCLLVNNDTSDTITCTPATAISLPRYTSTPYSKKTIEDFTCYNSGNASKETI